MNVSFHNATLPAARGSSNIKQNCAVNQFGGAKQQFGDAKKQFGVVRPDAAGTPQSTRSTAGMPSPRLLKRPGVVGSLSP